jgi:hypothetical protein
LSPLPLRTVAAGELLQHVGRTLDRGRPLYFGRGGVNRYDAPDRGYGVLYLAFDLATTLMESVFHGHRWHRQASRSIALAEVRRRMVRAVGTVEAVVLADLTAPDVMARDFGLNLGQLASRRYGLTRRVSAAVHGLHDEDGQPAFDGLVYPSRNNFPATCVALSTAPRPRCRSWPTSTWKRTLAGRSLSAAGASGSSPMPTGDDTAGHVRSSFRALRNAPHPACRRPPGPALLLGLQSLIERDRMMDRLNRPDF